MDKKISVIMACYNCESTLSKAIESIIAQTYDNWIMICCDDGSTDKTYSILTSYKEKYPDRFILLKNETNKQLPYSLNRCLEFADTELVARMDSDDVSSPDRFEKQVAFLENNPDISLVGTSMSVFDGEKEISVITNPEFPQKTDLLQCAAFFHATVMTYKKVYESLGGYCLEPTAIRVEDFDLWCRFFAAGYKGANIREPLYTILENDDAVKRRTLRNRYNIAVRKHKGYKLLGFKGFVLYKAYLTVPVGLIPNFIYKKIHLRRLKNKFNY